MRSSLEGGGGLEMMTSLYFPILFVKNLSHLDDMRGEGGKKSEIFDEVICERPLNVKFFRGW